MKIPDTHYAGRGKVLYEITYQGKLLIWRELGPPCKRPKQKEEKSKMTFSRQARLRMLQLVARVDWDQSAPCLFITLTYPDAYKIRKAKTLTRDRGLFYRYLERALLREFTSIWRVEWEARKTGKRIGEMMPHYHLLMFNVDYIPYTLVNEVWKNVIKEDGYVRTETESMANERQTGYYLAKYIGKAGFDSLVNSTEMDKIPSHRHWGIRRRKGLLLHRCSRAVLAGSVLTEGVRELAEELSPKYAGSDRKTFFLLGEAAQIVGNRLRDALDDNAAPF